MNTRDLEYFVALVEQKNFSQVATHFGVTQPTITIALKRLEKHFAIQLIDRDQSHGHLAVTPAGQQLYDRARAINTQLHLAEKELQAARQPKIRFGLPPINGSFYFPTLAPKLVAAGLMPRLETIEAGSQSLLQSLRAGDLDIALLGSDGPLIAPELNVQPLTDSPFTIVVPKSHPLANQSTLTFDQVATAPFVSLSAGFVHAQAFAWFSRSTGVTPQIVYRTTNVTLLKQLIQTGVGIALLTAMAVLPQDGLVALPLRATGQPRFCISVVTRRGQRQTPAMTQLLQIIH
ncbi:LysR family transcriptional regulator [Lacticaseibacillus sp. GG6-2]